MVLNLTGFITISGIYIKKKVLNGQKINLLRPD